MNQMDFPELAREGVISVTLVGDLKPFDQGDTVFLSLSEEARPGDYMLLLLPDGSAACAVYDPGEPLPGELLGVVLGFYRSIRRTG